MAASDPSHLDPASAPGLASGFEGVEADYLSFWRCSQAMNSFMAARSIISTFFASNFIVPAQVPPFSREETQLGSGEKVALSLSLLGGSQETYMLLGPLGRERESSFLLTSSPGSRGSLDQTPQPLMHPLKVQLAGCDILPQQAVCRSLFSPHHLRASPSGAQPAPPIL